MRTNSIPNSHPSETGDNQRREPGPTKSRDYFVSQFSPLLATLSGSLELGELCAQAVRTLAPVELDLLGSEIGVPARYIIDSARVGNDLRLCTEPVRSRLPQNIYILKDLTYLTDAELRTALDTGVINPEMTRADVRGGSWHRRTVRANGDIFATLFATSALSVADERLLIAELRNIAHRIPAIRVRGKFGEWTFQYPAPVNWIEAA